MNKERKDSGGTDFGLGGIFKGLGDIVEKLHELAETGQELSRSGELKQGEHVKGIYGFTVRVGLGDQTPRIEPFGNIRKDIRTGRTVVQETREPVVDLFDEEDCVLVIAEMPGITLDDVQIEVKDNWLTIRAEKGDKKYRKQIELPQSFTREKMETSCNNGVLEIKCFR